MYLCHENNNPWTAIFSTRGIRGRDPYVTGKSPEVTNNAKIQKWMFILYVLKYKPFLSHRLQGLIILYIGFIFSHPAEFFIFSSFLLIVQFIIDGIFGWSSFAQSRIGKHALKAEVFVNVAPMDARVGKVEILALLRRGVGKAFPHGEGITCLQAIHRECMNAGVIHPYTLYLVLLRHSSYIVSLAKIQYSLLQFNEK